jgi:hypothetical protein
MCAPEPGFAKQLPRPRVLGSCSHSTKCTSTFFFVCGEIVLIFVDRASRYEWIYFLDKKSDLPRILQQFLIDANSARFTVGSLINCPYPLPRKRASTPRS